MRDMAVTWSGLLWAQNPNALTVGRRARLTASYSPFPVSMGHVSKGHEATDT